MMTSSNRPRRRLRFVRPGRPTSSVAPVETQAAAAPPPRIELLPTQFISFRLVLQLYRLLIIAICIVCFVVTALGNVGLFGFDITRLIDRAYWQRASWTWLWVVPMTPTRAAVAGVVMQVIVQVGQFANAHHKRGWRYRCWLLASVVPSCWTYLQVIVPLAGSAYLWGQLWLYRLLAYTGAAIGTTGVLIGIDVAQEEILLRKQA